MFRRKRLLLFLAVIVAAPFLFVFRMAPVLKPGPHKFSIINTHEHFQSFNNVPKFLAAMRRDDVVKTVILGSPEATILSGRKGFYGEEKYNLEVIKIAQTYPQQFIAFPTINPHDPEKLEKFKRYLKMGGRGLKLYSGHSVFHDLPLDDPSMMPVFEFCERNRIPILFHVNAGNYQEEFERVLNKFPRLKIICPHFCLSSIASGRFEYLMDRYPHLYTDASFGYIDYLKEGLLRISKNPEKFRRLFIKYQDRIFFGTDMVVTSAQYKTVDWLAQVTRAYRDVLEKREYTFFAIPGVTLRGLALDREILEKVYHKNFERFFYGNKT